MTGIIILSVAVVALVMLAMAVGALFSNRCLRGSCGGPEVLGPDGQSLSCDTCPLRREQEVRRSGGQAGGQEISIRCDTPEAIQSGILEDE